MLASYSRNRLKYQNGLNTGIVSFKDIRHAHVHTHIIHRRHTGNCIHLHAHSTHARTHAHTHTYTHTHTYIHTYLHTYIHTYIRTYVHTYIRTYVHTYIRTYVHTYIRTYVHTYIRTYIHTYNMCIDRQRFVYIRQSFMIRMAVVM